MYRDFAAQSSISTYYNVDVPLIYASIAFHIQFVYVLCGLKRTLASYKNVVCLCIKCVPSFFRHSANLRCCFDSIYRLVVLAVFVTQFFLFWLKIMAEKVWTVYAKLGGQILGPIGMYRLLAVYVFLPYCHKK